jgi:hypothetical protein
MGFLYLYLYIYIECNVFRPLSDHRQAKIIVLKHGKGS